MNQAQLTHPSHEQLAAFGSGQLGPDEMAEVERHVAGCDACNAVLESLPDDSLVSLLKDRITVADAAAGAETLPAGRGQPVDGGVTSEFSVDAGAEPGAMAAGQSDTVAVPGPLRDHARYHVEELLGAGGMGAVYRARHRVMDRLVALKVINSQLVDRPGMVERFHREVKAAARLSHPNIVTAYDAEQAGDSHFLVMEFVEGTSLDRLVRERGPLPVAEACDYVRQTALGLEHAFRRGMVHRDIKPHNLMRTPEGQIKILDFGLAHFVSETVPSSALTETGTVMGTPDYIAPEQARDAHSADTRADLYSLGCTLYFLLAGRPPFPEGGYTQKLAAHLERMPQRLSELRGDVPPELARVVERMMAKDQARRYQTPAEAADALAPFATTVAAPARPPRQRWPWVAAAVVLLGVLGVGGALYGPAVYRIATDRGQLVIETADPDVEVVIKQGGQEVKIIDPKTGREVTLKAGTYQLELAAGREGLRLSTNRFTLERGGRQIVKVWREAPRVESAPLVFNQQPAAEPASEVRRFVVHTFGPSDKPLTVDGVTADQGGWRIEAREKQTVRLFEVPNPGVENCLVVYRARMKTAGLKGRAYLEMWCRLPGQGEFFSKGFYNAVQGTTDWASCEIPFRLEKGQRPDLIKLNVVVEGQETLWIKDVELLRTTLPATAD
jgi:hypothetical protein